MAHASRRQTGMPSRLLAGAIGAVLSSSLLIGTASWLARAGDARSPSEALTWWVQAWGAFAVWATLVTVPAVLLLGWPLDRRLAGMRPLPAALRFALLGLVVGAVAGFAILAAIDAGWVGAAVVAPVGALAAFVGRLLVDPLARRPRLLVVLAAATVALVAVGVAAP